MKDVTPSKWTRAKKKWCGERGSQQTFRCRSASCCFISSMRLCILNCWSSKMRCVWPFGDNREKLNERAARLQAASGNLRAVVSPKTAHSDLQAQPPCFKPTRFVFDVTSIEMFLTIFIRKQHTYAESTRAQAGPDLQAVLLGLADALLLPVASVRLGQLLSPLPLLRHFLLSLVRRFSQRLSPHLFSILEGLELSHNDEQRSTRERYSCPVVACHAFSGCIAGRMGVLEVHVYEQNMELLCSSDMQGSCGRLVRNLLRLITGGSPPSFSIHAVASPPLSPAASCCAPGGAALACDARAPP